MEPALTGTDIAVWQLLSRIAAMVAVHIVTVTRAAAGVPLYPRFWKPAKAAKAEAASRLQQIDQQQLLQQRQLGLFEPKQGQSQSQVSEPQLQQQLQTPEPQQQQQQQQPSSPEVQQEQQQVPLVSETQQQQQQQQVPLVSETQQQQQQQQVPLVSETQQQQQQLPQAEQQEQLLLQPKREPQPQQQQQQQSQAPQQQEDQQGLQTPGSQQQQQQSLALLPLREWALVRLTTNDELLRNANWARPSSERLNRAADDGRPAASLLDLIFAPPYVGVDNHYAGGCEHSIQPGSVVGSIIIVQSSCCLPYHFLALFSTSFLATFYTCIYIWLIHTSYLILSCICNLV
jgi:hypothetical protein